MTADPEAHTFYGGMRNRLALGALLVGLALHGALLFGVSRGTAVAAWFGGALVVASVFNLVMMARRRVIVGQHGLEVRVRGARRISWSDFEGIELRMAYRQGWVIYFRSRAERSDHYILPPEGFPVRQMLDAVASAAERHRPGLSPHIAELASRFPTGRMPTDLELWVGRRAFWLGGVVLAAWVAAWLVPILRLA